MKRIRKAWRKRPARRVKEEEAWIRELNQQLVKPKWKKQPTFDGRCAYCGHRLFPRWMTLDI